MSNSERVERFLEESTKLLNLTNGIKLQKIITEISKLQKWIQKHQDESLPGGHKDKLFQCIQSYYIVTVKLAENDLRHGEKNITDLTVTLADKVLELVEDLCKLPEGKLVSGKSSKAKALKWIDQLLSIINREGGFQDGISNTSGCLKKFELIDVSHLDSDNYELELMDPESGDVKNTVYSTDDASFKKRFENGESVLVEVDLDTHEVMKLTFE